MDEAERPTYPNERRVLHLLNHASAAALDVGASIRSPQEYSDMFPMAFLLVLPRAALLSDGAQHRLALRQVVRGLLGAVTGGLANHPTRESDKQ
eukprot:7556001-Pyramimonas_sp.AAC.1